MISLFLLEGSSIGGVDGFVVQSCVCALIGFLWLTTIGGVAIAKLERQPLAAWRLSRWQSSSLQPTGTTAAEPHGYQSKLAETQATSQDYLVGQSGSLPSQPSSPPCHIELHHSGNVGLPRSPSLEPPLLNPINFNATDARGSQHIDRGKRELPRNSPQNLETQACHRSASETAPLPSRNHSLRNHNP